MDNTKKRKILSLDVKYEIICEIDKSEKSKTQIAKDFEINPSTLSMIYKQKDAIVNAHESGEFSPKRKRMRSGNYTEIEECLFKWFCQARNSDIAVNGDILSRKAEEFAKKLGFNDFKCSSGFIDRFKKRRGIAYKNICGESKSVSDEIVDDWINEKLPHLIAEYRPEDIFNADETGLFFKCEPSKSLHLKGESCKGGKRSKERITVLLGSNMDGSEKLRPLVIGKFQNPRCFKNVKSLPVQYEANKRAWMNSELFVKWVRNLDKKFKREKRKVLLFIDNCPAHPKIENLKLIKLIFFPPNATSVLQPMDQGIINAVKVYFRKYLIEEKIRCMDNNSEFQVTVKKAIDWLNKAWFQLRQMCIANCFRKSGFSHVTESDKSDSDSDSDNVPLSTLKTQDDGTEDIPLSELQSLLSKIGSDVNAEDYLNVDHEVVAVEVASDDMICEGFLGSQTDTDDTDIDDDDIEQTENITDSDVRECIEKLKQYVQKQTDVDDSVFGALNELDMFLECVVKEKKKQTKVTDFFKK